MSASLRDYVAFQLGWAACVFLGNTGALLAFCVLLPLQSLWPPRRSGREWVLVLAFSTAGLGMDLAWQAAGLITFEGEIAFGIAPWLVVLWLMFSGTLLQSLAFLQRKLLLAAILGAAAGPLSYLAGIAAGAATSPHGAWTITLWLAPAWALFLPATCYLARSPTPRITPA